MNLAKLFIEYVIKPALDHLDMAAGGKGKLNSQAAINLIMMIVAHESGQLTYAKQIKGPALGFTQMEPDTYHWLVQWLAKTRPHLLEVAAAFVGSGKPEQMVFNPQYAVCMARLNLLRFPEAIPEAEDLAGLARYAKKYWNTSAGKATEQDYLDAYQTMIGDKG